MSNYPKWNSSAKQPNPDRFKEYVKDENLAKLIEGKKIAFVGPSPHLTGSGSGKFIDSYDIIIRPGQLFKIPEDRTKDIGSRTDIICHSFNVHERTEALRHKEFLDNLDYIICSMVSTTDTKEVEKFFDKLEAPIHKPSDDYLFKLFAEVGTTLNCGFACLLLLLKYDVKEVYVTGMSFYNMGKFGNIYYGDYMDSVKNSGVMKRAKKDNVTPKEARSDLHDQPTQIEFFRNLVKDNSDKIKIDQYLKDNL